MNYGAASAGAPPDCAAWVALFSSNTTTLSPISQSGTGVADVQDPAQVCSFFSGHFKAMRSTLKSPPIVEQFSATFQRVALSWTFAADSAAAGGGSVTADAITTLWTARIPVPGTGSMGVHIDLPFDGPSSGTHGATDYFSRFLGVD
jgi:hypothetical protein